MLHKIQHLAKILTRQLTPILYEFTIMGEFKDREMLVGVFSIEVVMEARGQDDLLISNIFFR